MTRHALVALCLVWRAPSARADVSATASSWAAGCERELRRAARRYDGESPWFDLFWKFRITPAAIEVRYTASVDICGVYDDFRIRLRRGRPAVVQKLHDDGGDFVVWRKLFEPALGVCSGEDDEQQRGDQGGPGISKHAKHDPPPRTSRATR